MDPNSAAYASLLTEAKMLNAEITSNEPFETNEGWVNGIYLNMMTAGWTHFDSAQIDSILVLAADCPYLGGFGVYKSRMLAMDYVPNGYYDDLWICNNLGVFKTTNTIFQDELTAINNRSTNNKLALVDNKFVLYPNPTNGLLNIDYKGNSNILEAELVLHDMLGKQVMQQTIAVGHVSIVLPAFANGLYTYTINSGSAILQRGKIQLDR